MESRGPGKEQAVTESGGGSGGAGEGRVPADVPGDESPRTEAPGEVPANLRIGTSGYVFDDWAGSFYPKGLPRRDWLAFYASEFSVVEINATYYRIPPPATMASMAARTPPSFRFVVKANQAMTHGSSADGSSRDPDVYSRFLDALAPMEDAGKLDGVLLQFPFSVRNEARHRAHLGFLREQFGDRTLWAEFRHESWDRKPVYDFLRQQGIGFCAVDEPRLDGLFPDTCLATSDQGYVRFHGRNAATWWGGGHERYNWTYTEGELSEWLEKLRSLASGTSTTTVFFNNCYMGRAVQGARLLQRLLGLRGKLELDLGQ